MAIIDTDNLDPFIGFIRKDFNNQKTQDSMMRSDGLKLIEIIEDCMVLKWLFVKVRNLKSLLKLQKQKY